MLKLALKSFLITAALAATASAQAEGPTVEWSVFHRKTGKVEIRVITPKIVQEADDYPIGYVQDLLTKSDVCYRGNPTEVLDQILADGIDHYGDESCDGYIVTSDQKIQLGPCTMSMGSSTYTFNLGRCE